MKRTILVTDAHYKHSIALIEDIRKTYKKEFTIIGLTEYPKILKAYKYCDKILSGCLIEINAKINPHFIIPVGSKSVKIASSNKFKNVIIPSKESLIYSLDKFKTFELAKKLNFKYPETHILKKKLEIDENIKYPIVCKPLNESIEKFDSIYVNDKNELTDLYKKLKFDPSKSYIIQQKIEGVGRGYFSIYNNSEEVCFYMHERIREQPITGGYSTAAKSIYCNKMKAISKKILEGLNWNGPVMLEYKYDKKTEEYFLLEINPKFWGSLELGIASGVNLGTALVSSYFNDKIYKDKKYQTNVKFYWPLDGDIISLFQLKSFKHFISYFKLNFRKNIGKSKRADLIKLIWLIKNNIFKIG